MEDEEVAIVDDDFQCDIKSILATPQRDFLIRKNGEQVKIDSLSGKIIVILYGSTPDLLRRQYFHNLVETYNEFSPRGEFEVVFVPEFDDDESLFHENLSHMPWLAVPLTEQETQMRIRKELIMFTLLSIVIVDASGKVLCKDEFKLIEEYGAEAYPFTQKRIKEIEEQEAAARKEQSLRSLLVSRSLDFVITNDNQKVPISELEGKIVGLYVQSLKRPLFEFTASLVEVYKILKERGENFEIVFVCLENKDECCNLKYDSLYKQNFDSMPWYALPFQDRRCNKLARYFGPKPKIKYRYPAPPPILVIIGADGKIINQNAAEVVAEHGVEAYPFTPERLEKLKEVGKEKQETQTLESLLVSGDHDFLLGNGDTKVPVSDLSWNKKVPVSDLVGKTILLVFLEKLRAIDDFIVQELTEWYDDIKEKDDAFEMILVPYNIDDFDRVDYVAYYGYPTISMGISWPGLILPFGDERIRSLSRTFKFYGNTMFVVLGPTGCTLRKDMWDILSVHGAEAFPFTDDHLRDTEARFLQTAKGWPEKKELANGDYRELVLTRTGFYKCISCSDWSLGHWHNEYGRGWSYYSKGGDFYLHPQCALEEEFKDVAKEDKSDTTDQSLRSALLSCSCDFLMSYNRKMVPISELDEKFVGLYFFSPSYKNYDLYCEVINLYEYLKKKEVNLEIVLVPLDVTYYEFKKYFAGTQWFSVPYKGKCREKLACYFNIPPETVLMIFGPDGKIVNSNAVSVIENYGYNVFPFTSERYAELAGMVRARVEARTLESVFISWEKDFVINKDGAKIPVIDLVGKNILLFFSHNTSSDSESEMVTELMVNVYKEIKAKDDAFEVIHILDERGYNFHGLFSRLPWLGIPCGDRRINLALLAFQIQRGDFPAVIALGPTGNLITRKAKDVILLYGADAYPFTDEHILEVETQTEEMAMGWPRKVKHALHVNYDLVLQNIQLYTCRECGFAGVLWTYCCQGCNGKYHPNCALGQDVGAQKCELPCRHYMYMYGPGNGRPCIMEPDLFIHL